MAGKRGRPAGFKMPEEHRNKIRVGHHLNTLDKVGAGELDISQTQLKAIEILLRKSLPDMQSIEHTGEQPKQVMIVSGVERGAANTAQPDTQPALPSLDQPKLTH